MAGTMRSDGDRVRARNLRTALILASIAAAFLLGFLLRRLYQ
ncbi:MAG TPA: cytochrome oxidase small assembly protein [Burkholderiales bacterium]|jgi:hypothetical protein